MIIFLRIKFGMPVLFCFLLWLFFFFVVVVVFRGGIFFDRSTNFILYFKRAEEFYRFVLFELWSKQNTR